MVEQMIYQRQHDSNNRFVKRRFVWTLLVVFLVLLLIVGLLSGILSAKHAKQETEAKYKELLLSQQKVTTVASKVTTITTKASPLTTQTVSCKEVWCAVRLLKNIVPYHYKLFLKTEVKELKYEGVEEVFFDVNEPTNTILIHKKQINIIKPSIRIRSLNASPTSVVISKTHEYPKNEYFAIRLASDMKIGKYALGLKFTSDISKTLTGFYNSSYKENGTTRVLLTTKFQPTDARRAFPCFDEPDLKATFSISVEHPSTFHARSNMPGTTVPSNNNGWSVTSFNKTVKMSTYLVCFIVSMFEHKFEDLTGINENISLAIWSRPDYINSTEYAYNTSKTMLTFLEEFLGVPYPMPKLDMFAIPDYGSGATEHWGIITYRESRLLYTPGVSSSSNKRSTAAIIAHETAHLWFGNLVTCKWWNDLWVQEGMASYLEYYAMNNSHPEWNMMDNFLTSDWSIGMTKDALASSHPISQPVNHPRQIKEIFDSITYNKGSSLFQMLDQFLGIQKFRQGLKLYLEEHQYKGATIGDLWDAFSKVSTYDINAMMNTWTHQMGFPVVYVTKTSKDTFALSQKHFLVNPQANVTRHSVYNYQWIIPFTYATSDDLNKGINFVFKGTSAQITSSSKWLLGNYMHRGFYRVNYDDIGWKAIMEQLNKDHTVFSSTDRAGIIDDVFNLARSNQVNVTMALEMLSFLEKDNTTIVWNMAMANLADLDKILSSQNIYSTFRTFMTKLIQPRIKQSNSSFISSGCKYGNMEIIKYVQKLFEDWVNGGQIPVHIRTAVYFCGVANGGDKEWDFVYKKYRSSKNPSEILKLQDALSATQKPWILNKWLQYSLDPSIVRSQDTVYVIREVATRNPIGKYLAWNFARENWLKIMNIAKENNFHVSVLTSAIASQFTTKFDLEQVEDLWKKYPDAGTGANARKQGIEAIKARIYWVERNYAQVEKWLKNKMST